MTSNHMNTPDSHLDVYLDGIRQKFNRLHQELDDARNERDEYKRNYTNQAKELQDLRQTVIAGTSKSQVICQHCKSSLTSDDNHSPILSPVSSSSECHISIVEEEGDRDANLQENYTANEIETRKGSTTSGDASLSPQSNATYSVEPNPDRKISLNLVHTLTQNGTETRAAFSMDGKYLVAVTSADGPGIVHIFDMKTGKSQSVTRDLYKSGKNFNNKFAFFSLCVSPDGRFFATGEGDGDVKIWVVSQWRVRNTFKHDSFIYALDFSPNGQYIAISSYETVVIRRLRDGFSRVVQSRPESSWSVRFSQDGRYVALGGRDLMWNGLIRILNARTGRCLSRHVGHSGTVRDLLFTPDGNGLLSASEDALIKYWDVSWLKSTYDGQVEDISTHGLREISRFVGHTDNVYCVSISPDDNWIASGSYDRTVRIWNAHTAALHCVRHAHERVMTVDFCRSGDYLAAGDGNGEVTIWNYTNLS